MADIVAAGMDDLADVRALLVSAGLPESDLTNHFFPGGYIVVRDGLAVIASAGLEVHGGHGLLRSLAVASAHRSKGLGRLLVDDRLRAARESGLLAVYLLTTTASEYFAQLGFSHVARESAPDAVQRSSEFVSLCPASAACMVKRLR